MNSPQTALGRGHLLCDGLCSQTVFSEFSDERAACHVAAAAMERVSRCGPGAQGSPQRPAHTGRRGGARRPGSSRPRPGKAGGPAVCPEGSPPPRPHPAPLRSHVPTSPLRELSLEPCDFVRRGRHRKAARRTVWEEPGALVEAPSGRPGDRGHGACSGAGGRGAAWPRPSSSSRGRPSSPAAAPVPPPTPAGRPPSRGRGTCGTTRPRRLPGPQVSGGGAGGPEGQGAVSPPLRPCGSHSPLGGCVFLPILGSSLFSLTPALHQQAGYFSQGVAGSAFSYFRNLKSATMNEGAPKRHRIYL